MIEPRENKSNDINEKTAKAKCRFRGEELLGPQASSRVSPCLPAPNHIRGEVILMPLGIQSVSEMTLLDCSNLPNLMMVQVSFLYIDADRRQ